MSIGAVTVLYFGNALLTKQAFVCEQPQKPVSREKTCDGSVYSSTAEDVNGHVLYVRGIETAVRTCRRTHSNKNQPFFPSPFVPTKLD